MTRNAYVAALLDLYLEAPDTPARASRFDRRIAAELHREGISFDYLAHAIRLATLRRQHGSHPAIRSLAYYRTVLQQLSGDEVEPDYIDYVNASYRRLRLNSKPRTQNRNVALLDRR